MSDNSLQNTSLLGVPFEAIPLNGTQSRSMLNKFITGDSVPEQDLCDEFGRNYRSHLQQLRGDRYLHWRFIDERDAQNIIVARRLDTRHLSGDRKLDALARAERRKELREDSHREAVDGASRVRSAYAELEEANQILAELKRENAQQN